MLLQNNKKSKNVQNEKNNFKNKTVWKKHEPYYYNKSKKLHTKHNHTYIIIKIGFFFVGNTLVYIFF
jgi:hypothetical protein